MLEDRLKFDKSQTQSITFTLLSESALVGLVVSPFIGHVADRTSNKKSLLLYSLGGAMVGTVGLAISESGMSHQTRPKQLRKRIFDIFVFSGYSASGASRTKFTDLFSLGPFREPIRSSIRKQCHLRSRSCYYLRKHPIRTHMPDYGYSYIRRIDRHICRNDASRRLVGVIWLLANLVHGFCLDCC
jgi:hypothetical protein